MAGAAGVGAGGGVSLGRLSSEPIDPTPAPASLQVFDGDVGRKVQHFATPPGAALLTIGRVDCDLVLDQPLVARRHAELRWERDHHELRDTGSAHGTWINGVRLEGARRLAWPMAAAPSC